MRLILGSQSPRRREIFRFFALPFEQVSPYFAEELIPFLGDPAAYTKILSEGKATSLAPRYPNSIIVTADTVVFKGGRLFNKPKDEEENFAMLCELNGSCHSVFTSVTALCGEKRFSQCQETRLEFHRLEESQLRLYHKTFSGCDKSGGYSIEMGGSVIVKKIEGCFYNVLGLPIDALQKVLKEVGIDLWHYLKPY